jgi:hypothetical protein
MLEMEDDDDSCPAEKVGGRGQLAVVAVPVWGGGDKLDKSQDSGGSKCYLEFD